MAKEEAQNEYHIGVDCPLPGFEGVRVVYNMLATEDEINAFFQHTGKNDSDKPVIVRVTGWDKEKYGDTPWNSNKTPMGFRLWAARRAWAKATMEFISSPNF